MFKRNNYKVEGFVVLLLIVLIGVWRIPQFLQSQRNMAEYFIQQDLDTVFQALRQYHQDHNNQLPPEIVNMKLNPWSAGQFGYRYQDSSRRSIGEIVNVLKNKGYSSDKLTFIGNQYTDESYWFIVKESGTETVYNFAILIPWMFGDHNYNHFYSSADIMIEQELRRLDYENQYGFKDSVTLINDFNFNPTNGLDSVGFVYQDLLGTKSTVD